ncbi:AAA family ATPase [Candidatus Woesearchaeota archaeon CG1_02_33_12]|nr:MAG: AAA family ATPase [Candidatus Woesearchaeota archaeon CG1_02_33_12]PIN78332.1 MAG: AAA family ATPase [Candidatus Woesearchaeota archaeon CG10_big_fil_rev_8_21_14_0_10_33_12]PIU72844.1 MAG: AAA family ATPase [Candidatus Woesearchaeota archaeon CG06_land_8_20_14_3_00_33_13]
MNEIIKTILTEWKEKNLPDIYEREIDLFDYSKLTVPKIIVITGFRRVGKTYIALHLIKKLLKEKTRENIIYLNFEDERIPAKTEFLTQIIPVAKQISKEKIDFLFLDEIQTIPNWSKWLRRIYDNSNIRIFVSGSSSKMSSKEIPTELRGRFLEAKVFPLSFKEFLRFKALKFDVNTIKYSENRKAELLNALNEYLKYGSLPEIVLSEEEKKAEIAISYYQTTVRRDIIERHNIKNEEALKALLRLMLNSTKYSVSKLYNNLKSMNYGIGKTTLQHYLGYIENSYFMFSVPIFSYKIKDQMQYPRKNYFIDNIFLTNVSTKFSKDYGRLYENIVAIELKRRNKDIHYWENSQHHEVDFVVKEGNNIKQLIQVCYNIDDFETKKREARALLKASNELKCKNLLIITENHEKEEIMEWFGTKRKIKIIPIWKWLLE